jgi:hypothetical protein
VGVFVMVCYNFLTAAPESDSFMAYVMLCDKRFNKNKG